MKAKKYIKSTASLVAVKKYFNLKVIASIVASLMLLYTLVALYNYTKENGTLLYNVAEAQITSTVPIAKGNIKTKAEVVETSSYSVSDGFEEAEKNEVGNYTDTESSEDTSSQNNRPSSTPTYNSQQNNNQINNSQNNNEVSKDLSFLKGTSISMIEGESFNPIVNLGIVAHDKDGTDITSRVSIDENNVDINNEGSYYVKASVKLNDGSTLEKVFTVKVNPKKEVTYEVNNFEMLENTAPKLGTARIFFDSKVSDDTISPSKATVNGIEYNINDFGKSGFGGTTRHYIDVNVGDISGEFKLNIEKIEFSNGVSVWPNKQMNVYIIKSEPVVSNFRYTEDKEGKISTTFDLKDLDNSLSNIKVSLYNEKGILVEEHKLAKKEKYNLDFSVEANGKYTLEVIGDVNLYNDLNRLNQSRVILSEDIQVSNIDKSKLEANDIEIFIGEEVNIDDLNIVALDKNGEDISNKVYIDTSNVDVFNAGEYEILLTSINSDSTKLEKVIKVVVKDNSITTVNTARARSTRTIYNNDNNNKNEYLQEEKTRQVARGVIDEDINTPAYASVTMTGNVRDDNGNIASGRIQVELPSAVTFSVDQDGNFRAPTNFEVNNTGSEAISISVIDFIENNTTGITIVSKGDNSLSTSDRTHMSLELIGRSSSGNDVFADLSTVNPNNPVKLFDNIAGGTKETIRLKGEVGKGSGSVTKGVSEDFTVKFRITKS